MGISVKDMYTQNKRNGIQNNIRTKFLIIKYYIEQR